MLGWFKRKFGFQPRTASPRPEAKYVVTFDDLAVTCRSPDGNNESVAWADLAAVIIETNDSGPLGTDILWLLVGANAISECVIPQGATGDDELLVRLQTLPGFDNGQFIKAMASTDNNRFLCWKR